MQHRRSARRITLVDEQTKYYGLNWNVWIVSSLTNQKTRANLGWLLGPDTTAWRGGGECVSQQTNHAAATTFNTAILRGLNSLIKLHFLFPLEHKKHPSAAAHAYCEFIPHCKFLQSTSARSEEGSFSLQRSYREDECHTPPTILTTNIAHRWTGRFHGCRRSELVQSLLSYTGPPSHVPIWPAGVNKTLLQWEIISEIHQIGQK